MRCKRNKVYHITHVIIFQKGLYTDPKSQICYANLDALEQLRERPPPWLSSFGGGSAAYHDTLKSLRNEE